jgi:hypothetical protein
LSRNLALLERSDLDLESRTLAMSRADECKRLLAMLDETDLADGEVEAPTPQQRRHARTKAKLRAALEALSSSTSSAPITAAAVAREAGVGRNVLYVGHTDILEDIRAISAARTAVREKREDAARTDAMKIRDLESQLASLATENAGLLRRAREAESRLERAKNRTPGCFGSSWTHGVRFACGLKTPTTRPDPTWPITAPASRWPEGECCRSSTRLLRPEREAPPSRARPNNAPS